MNVSADIGLRPGTWIPRERDSIEDALAREDITPDDVDELGELRLPVADAAGPELAVWAGRRVLADAAVDGTDIDVLVHAWTHYQGCDFWSPAHFVTDQLGAESADPIGVFVMCDGGVRGLGIAASRLQADDSARAALVTTGDRFAAPGFDRWRGDYGAAYGDAGTAVLVRCDDADSPLRLRAIGSASAPRLEQTHRALDGLTPASPGRPVDVRETMRAYFEEEGTEPFLTAARDCVSRAMQQACADAGVDPGEDALRAVYPPRTGPEVLAHTYAPAVADLTKADVRTTTDPTGHLGAGDGAAAMEQLVGETDVVRPGELALVLTGGAGFSWSAVLVERR